MGRAFAGSERLMARRRPSWPLEGDARGTSLEPAERVILAGCAPVGNLHTAGVLQRCDGEVQPGFGPMRTAGQGLPPDGFDAQVLRVATVSMKGQICTRS